MSLGEKFGDEEFRPPGWIPDGHGHPSPQSSLEAVTRDHLEHDHQVPNMALWAPPLWPILHARLHEDIQRTIDPIEGLISEASGRHHYDSERQCCACGFCVWTPEHIAIMAYREALASWQAGRG